MRWPYFLSVFFLLGAGLLLFFNILCGAGTGSVLGKFYWLQADTSSITNAHSETRWTSYSNCGVQNGRNHDCSKRYPGYPVSPRLNFDTTTGIPKGLTSKRGVVYYLTKVGWAFLLLGILSTIAAIVPVAVSICLPKVTGLIIGTNVATNVALTFTTLAACLLTAGYVKGRNDFHSDGKSASLGKKMFGFIWTSVFLLFLSSLLSGIGCLGGLVSKKRGRNRFSENYDDSLEDSYTKEKSRPRGGFFTRKERTTNEYNDYETGLADRENANANANKRMSGGTDVTDQTATNTANVGNTDHGYAENDTTSPGVIGAGTVAGAGAAGYGASKLSNAKSPISSPAKSKLSATGANTVGLGTAGQAIPEVNEYGSQGLNAGSKSRYSSSGNPRTIPGTAAPYDAQAATGELKTGATSSKLKTEGLGTRDSSYGASKVASGRGNTTGTVAAGAGAGAAVGSALGSKGYSKTGSENVTRANDYGTGSKDFGASNEVYDDAIGTADYSKVSSGAKGTSDNYSSGVQNDLSNDYRSSQPYDLEKSRPGYDNTTGTFGAESQKDTSALGGYHSTSGAGYEGAEANKTDTQYSDALDDRSETTSRTGGVLGAAAALFGFGGGAAATQKNTNLDTTASDTQNLSSTASNYPTTGTKDASYGAYRETNDTLKGDSVRDTNASFAKNSSSKDYPSNYQGDSQATEFGYEDTGVTGVTGEPPIYQDNSDLLKNSNDASYDNANKKHTTGTDYPSTQGNKGGVSNWTTPGYENRSTVLPAGTNYNTTKTATGADYGSGHNMSTNEYSSTGGPGSRSTQHFSENRDVSSTSANPSYKYGAAGAAGVVGAGAATRGVGHSYGDTTSGAPNFGSTATQDIPTSDYEPTNYYTNHAHNKSLGGADLESSQKGGRNIAGGSTTYSTLDPQNESTLASGRFEGSGLSKNDQANVGTGVAGAGLSSADKGTAFDDTGRNLNATSQENEPEGKQGLLSSILGRRRNTSVSDDANKRKSGASGYSSTDKDDSRLYNPRTEAYETGPTGISTGTGAAKQAAYGGSDTKSDARYSKTVGPNQKTRGAGTLNDEDFATSNEGLGLGSGGEVSAAGAAQAAIKSKPSKVSGARSGGSATKSTTGTSNVARAPRGIETSSREKTLINQNPITGQKGQVKGGKVGQLSQSDYAETGPGTRKEFGKAGQTGLGTSQTHDVKNTGKYGKKSKLSSSTAGAGITGAGIAGAGIAGAGTTGTGTTGTGAGTTGTGITGAGTTGAGTTGTGTKKYGGDPNAYVEGNTAKSQHIRANSQGDSPAYYRSYDDEVPGNFPDEPPSPQDAYRSVGAQDSAYYTTQGGRESEPVRASQDLMTPRGGDDSEYVDTEQYEQKGFLQKAIDTAKEVL